MRKIQFYLLQPILILNIIETKQINLKVIICLIESLFTTMIILNITLKLITLILKVSRYCRRYSLGWRRRSFSFWQWSLLNTSQFYLPDSKIVTASKVPIIKRVSYHWRRTSLVRRRFFMIATKIIDFKW